VLFVGAPPAEGVEGAPVEGAPPAEGVEGQPPTEGAPAEGVPAEGAPPVEGTYLYPHLQIARVTHSLQWVAK